MELKDFKEESIRNIVDGVTEAQALIKEKGAEINPSRVQFRDAGQYNYFNSGKPHFVEFDVDLASIRKSGTSEGIGVFLGSISLGKKNDDGGEHAAVTRIKFSLPLVLPSGGGEYLE